MTERRAVRAAHAVAVAAALFLVATAAGCAGTSRGTGARPDDAIVTIDCPVKDASLWVNGRYVRPIHDVRGGIALTPGKTHFIEVKHDRYHTYYAELTLERKERRKLVVRLAEVLP